MFNATPYNTTPFAAAAGSSAVFGEVIETLTLSSAVDNQGALIDTLLENMSMQSSTTGYMSEVIAEVIERIVASDNVPTNLITMELVAEALGIKVGVGLPSTETILEDITLTDSSAFIAAVIVKEILHLIDSTDAQMAIKAVERFGVAGSLTSQLSTLASIHEDIAISTVLKIAYDVFLHEDINLTGDTDAIAAKSLAVVETLFVTGLVNTRLQAVAVVTEALILHMALRKDFDIWITESMGFSDAVANVQAVIEKIIETAAFADLASNSARFVELVSDDMAISDDINLHQKLTAMISEQVNFSLVIRFGDEEYHAWAVNVATAGVSQYDNFNFESFAVSGNRQLAARDDGIYELTGDDDEGAEIEAWMRTGLMEFSTSKLKSFPECYLGYTADGRMLMKVVTTDTGKKIEDWYELAAQTAEAYTEARIKIGKGLRARYWSFELRNIKGSDFGIDELQLRPIILSRRIR